MRGRTEETKENLSPASQPALWMMTDFTNGMKRWTSLSISPNDQGYINWCSFDIVSWHTIWLILRCRNPSSLLSLGSNPVVLQVQFPETEAFSSSQKRIFKKRKLDESMESLIVDFSCSLILAFAISWLSPSYLIMHLSSSVSTVRHKPCSRTISLLSRATHPLLLWWCCLLY